MQKKRLRCRTDPSPWSPGPIKESVFKSRRISLRAASPCSSGRATSSMGRRPAKSVGGEALALQLDVTNQASFAAAAGAGILHAGKPGRPLQEMAESTRLSVASLDEVRAVFETNVFGVIAVTQAILPLLREAPAGRIVNVSSAGGSLTINADPAGPHRAAFGIYSMSKTALSAITLAFALDLESPPPASRSTPRPQAAPLRTSTTSRARAAWKKPRASQCVSRSSTRKVPRARSRTSTARSRGDVV